jgi:hypothetical protein
MNKKLNIIVSLIGASAIVVAGAALPAFAQTAVAGLTASTSVSAAGTSADVSINASLTARFKNIVTRADEEITRRINALNALSVRVNAMEKLSATEKSSLSANIQTELSDMTNLQAKVSADATANSTSSLLTDVKSITSSYRVFILVIPQGAIEAASDRVLTTASIMDDLSTKLSARISTAQTAGNNVTAATTALTDLNAKVSDSNAQATAAASEVSSLMPDNGNATIEASNTATLKDAHAKVLASQQDLIAARTDAQTIIKALATFKVSAAASASTTAQ